MGGKIPDKPADDKLPEPQIEKVKQMQTILRVVDPPEEHREEYIDRLERYYKDGKLLQQYDKAVAKDVQSWEAARKNNTNAEKKEAEKSEAQVAADKKAKEEAQQAEDLARKQYIANNVERKLPSFTKLSQQHLSETDLVHRAAELVHHEITYGASMTEASKKILRAREEEVYKIASANDVDLHQIMQDSMIDENGNIISNFGSQSWLEHFTELNAETMRRRDAHKNTVTNYAQDEGRRHNNYRPHLVMQYNDDGTRSLVNLQTGEPIDQYQLGFDDEDHYHLHGENKDEVQLYLKYLRLKEAQEHSAYDGVPPMDPELEEAVKDLPASLKERMDKIPLSELPTAKDEFYNKLTTDENGLIQYPKRTSGAEEQPPRFYRDADDQVGTPGMYHFESQSWVNPHLYGQLRAKLQENPGMHFIQGGMSYHGDNEAKSHFAFAVPSQAKRNYIQQNDIHSEDPASDQAYIVDNTGAISHMDNSFTGSNTTDHSAPQSIGRVNHDFHALKMEDAMAANPDHFTTPDGKQQPIVTYSSPQSFQNMFLQLEHLGRNDRDALARKRRDLGKEPWAQPTGWRPTARRLRHLGNPVAQDPLTDEELGIVPAHTARRGKLLSTIEWLENVPIAGKPLGLLLGRNTTANKTLRRIRMSNEASRMTERFTRESARGMVDEQGNPLSDSYIAPGEQKARLEYHRKLVDFLNHKMAAHHATAQNISTQEKLRKNNMSEEERKAVLEQEKLEPPSWRKNLDAHQAKLSQYKMDAVNLKALDPYSDNHWDQFNAMYDKHLGGVYQADSEEELSSNLPNVVQQPSSRTGRLPGKIEQPLPQSSKPQVQGAYGGDIPAREPEIPLPRVNKPQVAGNYS